MSGGDGAVDAVDGSGSGAGDVVGVGDGCAADGDSDPLARLPQTKWMK